MIICHFGPPWGHLGTHGGPQMAQNSTKMAYNCPKSLEWPKISLHDPKCLQWPQNSSQGYNTCLYAILDHPTAPLGPPKGPVLAQKGPFWGPGHPVGPDLVPTATGWSNWVGCIHIMCLGLLRDLCGTPGAPKGARFGPKGPF